MIAAALIWGLGPHWTLAGNDVITRHNNVIIIAFISLAEFCVVLLLLLLSPPLLIRSFFS